MCYYKCISFAFIATLIFLPSVVQASQPIFFVPLWTVSEDLRIWLNVQQGEQVGFGTVVVYLLVNESISINLDVFKNNYTNAMYFRFNYSDSSVSDLEISFRSLFAVIVIDNTVQIQSEKRLIFIDGKTIAEFIGFIWPVTLPIIIFSIWQAKRIKKRLEVSSFE